MSLMMIPGHGVKNSFRAHETSDGESSGRRVPLYSTSHYVEERWRDERRYVRKRFFRYNGFSEDENPPAARRKYFRRFKYYHFSI